MHRRAWRNILARLPTYIALTTQSLTASKWKDLKNTVDGCGFAL